MLYYNFLTKFKFEFRYNDELKNFDLNTMAPKDHSSSVPFGHFIQVCFCKHHFSTILFFQVVKGRSPIERRYDYGRTIYCFENNRSYAHPRSKSERLGVELSRTVFYSLALTF